MVWVFGGDLFVWFFSICGTTHGKSAKKHARTEMTRQTKILEMAAHLTMHVCGEKNAQIYLCTNRGQCECTGDSPVPRYVFKQVLREGFFIQFCPSHFVMSCS